MFKRIAARLLRVVHLPELAHHLDLVAHDVIPHCMLCLRVSPTSVVEEERMSHSCKGRAVWVLVSYMKQGPIECLVPTGTPLRNIGRPKTKCPPEYMPARSRVNNVCAVSTRRYVFVLAGLFDKMGRNNAETSRQLPQPLVLCSTLPPWNVF